MQGPTVSIIRRTGDDMNESTPVKGNRDPIDNDDRKTARSESLLPASTSDSGDDDASFNVAEEVSLDQQSDRLRQLGNLPADGEKTPAGSVATAVAETLSPQPAASSKAGEAAPTPSRRGD
jgi:hypothetical protein